MSKYIDLIEQLSAEDRETIEKYIYSYGTSKTEFIGVDKWLQNWSHSNQRLYALLGNKLIHKIEISCEKSPLDLEKDFNRLLNRHPFRETYHQFYLDYIIPAYNRDEITYNQKQYFNRLTDLYTFINDRVTSSLKYKRIHSEKTLQLQEGMKPIRAMAKIVKYFPEFFDEKEFEDFRIAHSMVLNDKWIKGNLCFSIHPMDYMTMSDNASNWTSCMNWKNNGCYHLGTVEMMNSNNAICCYLESKDPFYFEKNNIEGIWNNKKWRTLAYVTKDIILSGKNYPYYSEEISKKIVENLRDLAKDNLNWSYSYGIEPYKDMKHITGTYPMMRARDYASFAKIHPEKFHKFNILFDTKAMYNDMLNDNEYNYWCYRNKVSHTKIYSVSGKAPCLCCGNEVGYFYNDTRTGDYNERYDGTGYTICRDCRESKFTCGICSSEVEFTSDTHTIKWHRSYSNRIDEVKICNYCLRTSTFICPCCGKPFISKEPSSAVFAYYVKKHNTENIYKVRNNIYYRPDEGLCESNDIGVYPCICCTYCRKTIKDELWQKDLVEEGILDRIWGAYNYAPIFKKNIKEEDVSKYFLQNNPRPKLENVQEFF